MIRLLLTPFRLRGRLARAPYIIGVWTLLFAQHLLVFGILSAHGIQIRPDLWFWLAPLRSLALLKNPSGALLLTAFAANLAVAWVLTALSFRRAAAVDRESWWIGLAFAPGVHLAVFLYLSFQPDRARSEPPPLVPREPDGLLAALGVLSGLGLTIAAVAIGALIFGRYGYAMFVLAPFFVGCATGYVVNSRGDIGGGDTLAYVLAALSLGAIGLLLSALEGVICLLLVSPLAAGVGLIGGAVGRAVAGIANPSSRPLASVAVLPLFFMAEVALPPEATFETSQSTIIAAQPEAVWDALVGMDKIGGKPALPFRLGMAYPTGAVIAGAGVGAERLGEFSTGVAVEQVTAWEPGRRLAFEVLSNPPAMRELSFYKHVHAPHVVGYFDTTSMEFEITPLGEGRSRLTLKSEHVLKLDPVLYWLPMARWVVAADNARVLTHVKGAAES